MARGRCLQQFGSGEPYLPVFEALDQLSQALGRRLVESSLARPDVAAAHAGAHLPGRSGEAARRGLRLHPRAHAAGDHRCTGSAFLGRSPWWLPWRISTGAIPPLLLCFRPSARRTVPGPPHDPVRPTGRRTPEEARLPCWQRKTSCELHRQCKVLPLAYLSEAAPANT